MWNTLVRTFRSDIPLGRHRRYMKTYDDCFVASDAVAWLLQYLQKNPNFDTTVTKTQTIQLLQKLHKARVFEDVRGSKHNHGEVTDSGRLFRLTTGSPLKSIRTPLALKCNLKLANQQPRSPSMSPRAPRKLDFTKTSSVMSLPDTRSSTLPECHFVIRPLSTEEIEEEWKAATLLSLQKVLGVDSLENVIDPQLVSGRNIMHNCLYINKSGVVTNIQSKDQLPHWALSAMKCLAYWPDKVDSTLPNYPGFERDVFRVVKDYFCGLSEPLMTHAMYEVITNVFVEADRGKRCKHIYSSNNCAWSNNVGKGTNTFKSVENLLLKLSESAMPSSECQDICEEEVLVPGVLNLSPIHPVGRDTGTAVYSTSTREHTPVTRYETAFGPDNRTVTRVFFGDGVATDFKHDEGDSRSQHTPVETHFDGSLDDVREAKFNRNSVYRHSANNFLRRKPGDKNSGRDKIRRRRTTHIQSTDSIPYGTSAETHSRITPGQRSRRANCAAVTDSLDNGVALSNCPVTGRPPKPCDPPSYHSLYPESVLSKPHKPVIDGAKKVKRKKSLSSSFLNRRRSFLDSSSSSKEDFSMAATQESCCDKDIVGSRSRSLSDLATTVHIENRLQDQCDNNSVDDSEDSVCVDESTDRIIQALQLVCLLIPPANRRRLHLLLRLMNKISTNTKLVLSDSQSSRNLLLETFYRVVLTSLEEVDMDDVLVIQLVAFLMDHYIQVMSVPSSLKVTVEQRLATLQRTKVRHVSADDTQGLRYCDHVTMDEYEKQRLTGSQQALAELLEVIIADTSKPLKERKKRLKQFKETYPDIYNHRFPGGDGDLELFGHRPKIKPPLLAKPLLKLKGLRL